MRPSPAALVIFRIDGALREALELDDVHERLALHAAEAAGVLALEQRLDAIDKVDDLFPGLRLLDVEVDAHGVGAGAELLVLRAGHHDHAQRREFPPHDGEHLKAIHGRHAQIDEQEIERLAFQQRDGARAVVGGVDFRLAGEAREDLLVDLQDVVFVVENEDALAGGHGLED